MEVPAKTNNKFIEEQCSRYFHVLVSNPNLDVIEIVLLYNVFKATLERNHS